MLSLPQVYGLYTTDEQAEMDRIYKPLALSNKALEAAFQTAASLRNRIYSDDPIEDLNEWTHLAGQLTGAEEIFNILGVLGDYIDYIRFH